jgi:hypothetical protein
MKKMLAVVAVACLVVGLAYGPAFSARTGKVDPDVVGVPIYISPHTLVLDSAVTCVTVHADIPLSAVDTSSLQLNGLVPYAVFDDSRGLLVAKFYIAEVAAIVAPPSAKLTLTGMALNEEGDEFDVPFSGSDTIVVK